MITLVYTIDKAYGEILSLDVPTISSFLKSGSAKYMYSCPCSEDYLITLKDKFEGMGALVAFNIEQQDLSEDWESIDLRPLLAANMNASLIEEENYINIDGLPIGDITFRKLEPIKN